MIFFSSSPFQNKTNVKQSIVDSGMAKSSLPSSDDFYNSPPKIQGCDLLSVMSKLI
jgi:hypothetical protein